MSLTYCEKLKCVMYKKEFESIVTYYRNNKSKELYDGILRYMTKGASFKKVSSKTNCYIRYMTPRELRVYKFLIDE